MIEEGSFPLFVSPHGITVFYKYRIPYSYSDKHPSSMREWLESKGYRHPDHFSFDHHGRPNPYGLLNTDEATAFEFYQRSGLAI